MYSERAGALLRSVRKQQGFSLQDVEKRSAGEFSASALGAYERGDRAITLQRVARLAEVYAVPVAELVSPSGDVDNEFEKATVDIEELRARRGALYVSLARFCGALQVQRQDFNGRVITVRESDWPALAAILETDVAGVPDRLEDLGLRFRAAADS